MTLSSIYKKAVKELKVSGDPTAELDAGVLLEFVTHKDRADVVSHPQEPLTNSQNSKFQRLIKRRKNNEPIAYITGHKEFYGYDFNINKNTLIPRPESEELVSLALERIKQKVSGASGKSDNPIFLEANISIKDNEMAASNFHRRIKKFSSKISPNIQSPIFNILDMGTGSGCIIISLYKKCDELDNITNSINFSACDISPKALYVAKKNAIRHEVNKNIKFYCSDLFQNRLVRKKYDIIIANLPYVPKKVKSFNFEPQEAIFADDNGTSIIKKFLDESKKYLAENGLILIELDPRNALDLNRYAKIIYPNARIELKKDLASLDRYLIIDSK